MIGLYSLKCLSKEVLHEETWINFKHVNDLVRVTPHPTVLWFWSQLSMYSSWAPEGGPWVILFYPLLLPLIQSQKTFPNMPVKENTFSFAVRYFYENLQPFFSELMFLLTIYFLSMRTWQTELYDIFIWDLQHLQTVNNVNELNIIMGVQKIINVQNLFLLHRSVCTYVCQFLYFNFSYQYVGSGS